jgi:ribonuclease VapC
MGSAQVILDSSAIVAILRDEPERAELTDLIEQSSVVRVSTATVLESCIVVGPSRHADVDQLLREAATEIVAFDGEQLKIAREAHARYGRRSRSRAKLNFGDCMAYALAKVTAEPLLFKGDDFTHTDVTRAG